MRRDMAKVVTGAPRRGHANPSKKWGRRLTANEYRLDDHGATKAPMARHHQYGWNAKEFSGKLGPLRRYLRTQVGRPWNRIWSEITEILDSRSLAGQHIFDHIRWEVERETWLGENGRVYRKRQWGSIEPVSGLYVHPVTGILRFKPEPLRSYRGGPFLRAQSALRHFGISANTADAVRRYRIDGLRLWEQREAGWFIHTYHDVPEQLTRVITRSDGHEVPIYSPAGRVRVATKQASKKEIRGALPLLQQDPLATARRFKP